MRLVLALLFPPAVFFTIWRPFQGVFCFFLWIFFFTWPIAALWAVYALSQYRNDQLYAEMYGHGRREDRFSSREDYRGYDDDRYYARRSYR